MLTDVLVETLLADMKANLYAGTLEQFEKVFPPEIHTYLSNADTGKTTIEEIWDQLQAYGVDGFAVEAAFAPPVYKNAHVIVAVVCENSEPNGPPLLNGAHAVTQQALELYEYAVEFSMPVTDSIGIYIMAPNRPILRFVDLLVKSTLFSATSWLNENLINGPIWNNTSDLAPVTQLVGKETVLKYVRKQTWNFHSNLAVRPFGGRIIPLKQIIVHAVDTFVNSSPNPETREVTPLDSTSQGRVKPVTGT